MAVPVGVPCVQVAFPAALSGRLARHQRLRLRAHQFDRRTVAAIPRKGLCVLPARSLWRTGPHALARHQGRQASAVPRRSVIPGPPLAPFTSASISPLMLLREDPGRAGDLTSAADVTQI